MLKIKFFFNVNIDFKKNNNNVKTIFYKNVKKMMFVFNKKKKIFPFIFLLQNSIFRKGLITILKSPFHYKTTKLNISENFKKLNIIFFLKNVDNINIILNKQEIKNSFPVFNYFFLKKINVTFITVI